MNFKYFPHTEEEIKQMLAKAGMESLDDLYSDVPEQIRFKGEYDLPEPLSEAYILRENRQQKPASHSICRSRMLRPLHSGYSAQHHLTL